LHWMWKVFSRRRKAPQTLNFLYSISIFARYCIFYCFDSTFVCKTNYSIHKINRVKKTEPESPPPDYVPYPPFEIYCGICHRWFLDDGSPQKHSVFFHTILPSFELLLVAAFIIWVQAPIWIYLWRELLNLFTK